MRLFFLSIGLGVVLFLFNSCASVDKIAGKITIESGEIPPSMKDVDFTLIGILKGQKNYDKHLIEEFSSYTGKYVFCEFEKLPISSEYNDVDKYRYFLHCQIEVGYKDAMTARFYIYDRKENKKYRRKASSSFYVLEIRAYLMAIERVRKK